MIFDAISDEAHMNGYHRMYPRPFRSQREAREDSQKTKDKRLNKNDLMLREWYRQQCLDDFDKCLGF